MKKAGLILILSLIFIVTSCTTIEPQFTDKRPTIQPSDDYYDYDYDSGPSYRYDYDYGYYGSYYPYFHTMPSIWFGLNWWNPFWYYGFYDYYYWYHPRGYMWGYNPTYVTRNGRPVVRKSGLQKPTTRTIPRGTVRGRSITSSKGTSGTKSRGTVSKGSRGTVSKGSRGTVSKGTVSRGSSGSKGTSSRGSSGSSGTKVRKKK
ncbi:hypothetical protein ACFLT9_01055 [Acidobacteriota bacterium]